jgi:S-adenosylmethionine/arginine decarboxylase-like enzyme
MVGRWGYHLIIDAASCIPKSIRCPVNIENFSNTLVKRIDMVPYGKPQIVMFGTGNKKGYTLVQLIETSNITGHFVEETNDLYLDVFSCKPFDISIVQAVLNKHFLPENVKATYLERQAEHKELPGW